MARRLEKIEKEMGYCDVKLEKERRTRKQIEFLRASLDELNQMVRLVKPHDVLLKDEVPEIGSRPSREAFLAAGLLDLLRDKRDVNQREIEELQVRLEHYDGFVDKKRVLEDEKKNVMRSLTGSRSSKLRRLNEEFKKIEKSWNELTEDLLNVDEAIFFVDRNLDYLRSARNFLISAKGNYDVENWRRDGYLTDLFRHSSIGRAREMADGADRNLQSAQKELVCLSSLKRSDSRLAPGSPAWTQVLISFIDALYDDIFVSGQIRSTVQVIEAALASNLKIQGQLQAKKESMAAKLEQIEKARGDLFQRMGAGQRSELTT